MSTNQVFRDLGISFQYPADWELQVEPREDGHTVTVNDGVAFWSMTMLTYRPPVEEVIEQAISAFEEEYEEMDVYKSEVEIARRKAQACKLEFVALELINTAFIRIFRTGRFTAFVLYQHTDHEQQKYEPLFTLINSTLDCDQDGDILIA